MSKSLRLVLPLMLMFAVPAAVQAQTAPGSPAQASKIGAMPARGMTQDQVRQRFGEPRQRLAPVGKPPISRWQYEGMTIYFEGRYVIHAVATNDQPQ